MRAPGYTIASINCHGSGDQMTATMAHAGCHWSIEERRKTKLFCRRRKFDSFMDSHLHTFQFTILHLSTNASFQFVLILCFCCIQFVVFCLSIRWFPTDDEETCAAPFRNRSWRYDGGGGCVDDEGWRESVWKWKKRINWISRFTRKFIHTTAHAMHRRNEKRFKSNIKSQVTSEKFGEKTNFSEDNSNRRGTNVQKHKLFFHSLLALPGWKHAIFFLSWSKTYKTLPVATEKAYTSFSTSINYNHFQFQTHKGNNSKRNETKFKHDLISHSEYQLKMHESMKYNRQWPNAVQFFH